MAKVSFTKLGLVKNQETKILEWNEQNIEVKQYLPINDKLNLISNVINYSHEPGENYSNPMKVELFTTLEILYHYTNISFTEKQKEDVIKLYDLVVGSELYDAIIGLIPEGEYCELIAAIDETIYSIYSYQNSVLGILDNVNKDYSNLNFDAANIQKMIGDPDNLGLLREVLDKLG